MESHERTQKEKHVARLVLLLAALERRHELVEALWTSRNTEDAILRIHQLLEVADEADPMVVLDLQLHHMTQHGRDRLEAELTRVRDELNGQ